jgi:signal transduction histidine kinase
MFVERLLLLADLSADREIPAKEAFDPRALFSEVVAKYKPGAEAKGLQLLTDCLTAPATVMGNRTRVKALAQILLEDAIEAVQSGRVSFVFDFSDVERWVMTVSDTGSGQLSGGERTPGNSLPDGGLSLALLKELAGSLGGSLQTTIQTGWGRRLEVSLPRT